jgi:hypothetical protein
MRIIAAWSERERLLFQSDAIMRGSRRFSLVCIVTVGVLAALFVSAIPPARIDSIEAADQRQSIGQATMEPDGTIVLRLRAEGPGGMRGDGLFRYPPDHPQYRSVLDHLGGMRPGENKPVPPWD